MQEPQWVASRRPARPDDHDEGKFAARRDTEHSRVLERLAGVLIVEDDFLIGMQAERALADAGIRVVGIASTAEEAVLLARQHKPVLAVMDIRLAGQRDGVDAAGELFRELGVRCIFATAHDDQGMRSRAAPFAPLGWLAKPYSTASLIALVRRAMAKG
jgi:two-component system, response regulator PdtaR